LRARVLAWPLWARRLLVAGCGCLAGLFLLLVVGGLGVWLYLLFNRPAATTPQPARATATVAPQAGRPTVTETPTVTPEPTWTPTLTPDPRVSCQILAWDTTWVVYHVGNHWGTTDVFAWQYGQAENQAFRIFNAEGQGAVVAQFVKNYAIVAIGHFQRGLSSSGVVTVYSLLGQKAWQSKSVSSGENVRITILPELETWFQLGLDPTTDKLAEVGEEVELSAAQPEVPAELQNTVARMVKVDCIWPPSG
jgi:hypothetical protein